MDSERALTILDAAYAQGLNDEAWLRGLVAALEPFDRGLGIVGYFVELGGPGEFRAHGHVGTMTLDIQRVLGTILDRAGTEFMRQAHLLGPFATTAEPSYAAVENASSGLEAIAGFDAGAAAGLMAINPNGLGISFGTYAPRGAPHRSWDASAELAFWQRIVPHLVTAYRLRCLLAEDAMEPEAVMEPGGRIVHAAPPAQRSTSQDELRRAVVRIDRAHSRSDAEALDLWRCMVQRRWTLVDQFESDGRRYVVAFPNEAQATGDPRLSPKEQVVASAAAVGHSNKVIAEELGVAESTVATHLTRAARKLGVRTRTELVQTIRSRAR